MLRVVRIVVLLEIASLTAGVPTNPNFVCRINEEGRNMNVSATAAAAATAITQNSYYTVTLRKCDEIVVENCDAAITGQILARVANTTSLQTRPILLRSSSSYANLNAPLSPYNTRITNLDLSRNELIVVDLRRLDALQTVNLTANRISTLRSIKLSKRAAVLRSLDVTRNRLYKFEHLFIPPAERLYLRSNNILRLDTNVTLPSSLRLLDLTRNEIENVHLVAFHSANLIALNLSVNLIKAISKRTFENLPSLRTLILECNKIARVESAAFSSNRELIELNLRDNNLSSLTKGVLDSLVNLQVLDVSKNDLLELPPNAVQNLNNLVDFSVSENVKLCDAGCGGEHRRFEFLLVLGGRLRALRMDRLRLEQFPVILTTSVRRLDLRENRLRAVQQGNLDNFPLLETLNLGGNEIDTVENDVFSRMEFLRQLRLDNNRLTRVPTTLPRSLQILHLHKNRIRQIDRNDFAGLYALRHLKLDSNAIRSVESGAFGSLRRLEILDVSANPIFILGTDAFDGPTELQRLFVSDLSQTVVNATDLRYFPISEMKNLRQLDLSGSPRLTDSFLADLPLLATAKQLELLDLSRSNLTRLPSHLDNFLPRLIRLNASGNPLDCADRWWYEWRQSATFDRNRVADQPAAADRGLKIRVSSNYDESTSIDDDFVVFEDRRCGRKMPKMEILSGDEYWSRFLVDNTTATRSNTVNARQLSPKHIARRQSTSNGASTIETSAYTSSIATSTRRYYRRKKHETITASPFDLLSQNLSFFDWFPATGITVFNDSSHRNAAAALDDRHVEYTHPGLVIFEVIVCFLFVLFLSMVVPPCLQKYRWNRHRRKMCRFDEDECRRSIEISSVSAFVETESEMFIE